MAMSGNYGRYNNPKADELIALGNSASDVEARKGYYRELMEIYMEDVPSVAMYAVINAIAHSNQLVMEDANILSDGPRPLGPVISTRFSKKSLC